MTPLMTLTPESLSHLVAARNAALNAIAETLWPTRCALCDAPGAVLCDRCRRALPYIDVLDACPRCGAPFGRVQCTECNPLMTRAAGHGVLPCTAMASALSLTEEARRLVTVYKDQGEQRLACDLAALMARYVPPRWLHPAPTVAFVPATATARRRRGFDHGELLARELSRELGLAWIPLLAAPHHRDQRKLSRRQRLENASRSMDVLPGATVPPSLILTDDVCTTGATLYAAASALVHAGAETVYGLTVARA